MRTVPGAAILLTACLVAASVSGGAPAGKAAKKNPPLSLQGFRIGMKIADVRGILRKRNVTGFETGFSDLYSYRISPDTELGLAFTCSAKGYVLREVTLNAVFETQEAVIAIPKYRAQMISRYGTPALVASDTSDALDFCWGRCESGSTGSKLEAKTDSSTGEKATLVLRLSDASLGRTCRAFRQKKINQWLSQWITGVQKFRIGMTLEAASLVYAGRYKDTMVVNDEQEQGPPAYPMGNSVVQDYDFFSALDPDSRSFEGEGPGSIILKFTGDRAGKGDKTNKRLYYSYFSTTRFTTDHLYSDLTRKLEKFIKAYGKPTGVVPQPDGILAVWDRGPIIRKVEILDSGLITVEQSAPSIADAYRNSVIKRIEEYNKTKFDKNIF